MKRTILFAATLLLAACASEPKAPPAPPAPVMLTDAQYDEAMRTANVVSDAFQEERNYTAMLARKDLTPEQLWRTQYMRAVIRGTIAYNLAGSIKDYEELFPKVPADHRLAKPIADNLQCAITQRGYIEGLINRGPAGQSRGDYLNDLVAMGRWEEAKAFVKQTGMNLSDLQAEKFAKMGLMCEGEGYAGYRWGYSNTGYHNVGWCDAKGTAPAAPVSRYLPPTP
jgi:hypothetical protein